MQEFEHNGLWWLPENPDNKISGVLKFHPVKGVNLELIGSFRESITFNRFLNPGIILGITSNGKLVTLYKCLESQSLTSIPGFTTSTFIASMVFLRHHFENEENIQFDSLSLSYSHLDEWVGITGFQEKTEIDSEKNFKKYEVSYNFPEKTEVKINGFNLSIDYKFNIHGNRVKEINLKQKTIIEIALQKKIHFNDLQKDICYHIQTFLSLAMRRAIRPLAIIGRFDVRKGESTNKRVSYNDTSIFYATKDLPYISEKIHPFDMLFTFRDISDNFGKYLRNWFEKIEIIQPAHDLYFGNLYSSSMYVNHRFLNLIQAIESYHRRAHCGKYLPDDDYAQIYKTLITAVPGELDSDFRESLRQKLKYHNEFSLRRRMKEILEKCGDPLKLLIYNKERFIDNVVNTRNFLIHFDKNLETKAINGQELYVLVQKMEFIIEICFLIELEIPMQTIKTLISRNQKYQFLAKQEKSFS